MFDLCDIIADKVNRIQELEDEVQELGLSFGELSHQLAVARSEANSNLHSLNAKIKELEDVKDNAQVESQMANHKHKQVLHCLYVVFLRFILYISNHNEKLA